MSCPDTQLFELARQDFANAITPTVVWRQIMEKEIDDEAAGPTVSSAGLS